jgi:hypothetical protein
MMMEWMWWPPCPQVFFDPLSHGWCNGVEDLSMEVARQKGSAINMCGEDDDGS